MPGSALPTSPRPPSTVQGLPNICGEDASVAAATSPAAQGTVFTADARALDGVRASAGIALHMHQPTVPAGGDDIPTAGLICHLQYMYEHTGEGDNHNAAVFEQCYGRIADFVRELQAEGRRPRVMLDYSGNLLWGLEQMGRDYLLDKLRDVTCNPAHRGCVEWLGTMWSHSVVPSTPVPDIKLHIRAFQHHFASLFGWEALSRVRGFSPPEMHLPNHPDVAYAYVSALRECGYRYVLVQEHTVELPDGSGLREKHLPMKLVARASDGRTASITALIKTQGSDTKLVAQMQPLHEARTLQRREIKGRSVPGFVSQIGDGENGGVMMNEFPSGFKGAVHSLSPDVPLLNGWEYLEGLSAMGVSEDDFAPCQPAHQARFFKRWTGGGPAEIAKTIEACRKEDHRFHMDGGSWTNDRSWVAGYEGVINAIDGLSAKFHEVLDGRRDVATSEHRYRNALLHLLLAETSCYRYWGQGRWTDYAKELCRRGHAILTHDF